MTDFDNVCCSAALAESPPLSRPATILAIDDDPNISMAMQCRFRPLGVEVLRAFHGMQGISLATTEMPDLIITDLTMPEGLGHGYDVVQNLKGKAETRHIPIVVLTGEPNGYMKRQLESLGVEGYLTKPVDFTDLRDLVGRFVDLAPPQ